MKKEGLLRCLRALRPSRSSGPLSFVKKFTSKEIERATDEFSTILESGPQGMVYRARFADGIVATIKQVRSLDRGKDTFYREVQRLGRLHHRHLVRLQGFSEGEERFLVFDHMENGSLKECLHDPLRTPLNWTTRLQIAIGVAAALLSDVGLADCNFNCTSESNSSSSGDHIDQRSRDLVFQFGVLLLELITGQSLDGEVELVQWVQESGFVYSMHKMVDADLGDSYDSKELKCLLFIARLCTRTGSESLISIRQILRYLQGRVEHSIS
ncbi:probable receptor-like protein kinase At1g49730 isoform X3 [Typha angustifolia]|uniref:probable receptor-like protein kinase At1g49730 isoform X3 n=1 Tax=Typha angustifolia TaxID=59011 RepID=UPI003C2CED33